MLVLKYKAEAVTYSQALKKNIGYNTGIYWGPKISDGKAPFHSPNMRERN